jgi:hypothetical protein
MFLHLHGRRISLAKLMPQKMEFFIISAARTSNPTYIKKVSVAILII